MASMQTRRLLFALLTVSVAIAAQAQQTAAGAAPDPEATAATGDRFAIHGQVTFVEQAVDNFRVPYSGPNSLTPDRGAETLDVTLFLGSRLWSGAEAWLDPEIDQGFG